MTKVDVVQVFCKTSDSHDSAIGNLSALCKDEVSKTGRGGNDLLDSSVLQFSAVGQIENAQTLKSDFERKVEECVVGDAYAMGKTQFAKVCAFADQGSNSIVFQTPAIRKVNFKKVAAVLGKGNDGSVCELMAAVELELQNVSG